MSSVGISLSTRTRLSASPHMQQAVRLLQLSTTEFAQELQQALVENPFLEEVDDQDIDQDGHAEGMEGIELVKAGEVQGELDAPDFVETPPEESAAFDGYEPPAAEAREVTGDPFESSIGAPGNAPTGASSGDASDWVRAETNLRTHLLEQICGWGVDQRQQIAATIVVESLDDDGYLRVDIHESVEAAGVVPALTAEEIEQAIQFVQTCDPIGVGARDLSECLMLQVAALADDEPGKPLAELIARHHLDQVAHHRFATLRQALSCDDEELNLACNLIRRLDPRPGHRFSAQRPEYVVPDVIVQQRDGELVALVNPGARPNARLNQCYVQMFRASKYQEHPALSQQLQEARWLMHNVEQRFVTIQRVADAIVRRQRNFFVSGEIALKPLVLREVADDLGLHESTVSRATSNKYMDTPRGLFEFRHFFSRSLVTETGSCSAAAVRALMTDMIAEEPCSRPLSDVDLARKLSDNGVRVSRRTVTKYRNLMKVAPVEMRKRA